VRRFLIIYLSLYVLVFSSCTQKSDQVNNNKLDKHSIIGINRVPISYTEFIDFFHNRPRLARKNSLCSSGGELDPNKILKIFIENKLLVCEARARGLQNCREVIQQKRIFVSKAAINLFLRRLIDPLISIDEAEVLNQIPPAKRREVKFRRILVATEDKAKEIEAKIKKGVSFDKLVLSESLAACRREK
jgi:parvulin-like peptidyl-prolyl isomerase